MLRKIGFGVLCLVEKMKGFRFFWKGEDDVLFLFFFVFLRESHWKMSLGGFSFRFIFIFSFPYSR